MRQRTGILAIAFTVLCCAALPGRADYVNNLGFASGLTGWQVSEASLVTVVAGKATIVESTFASETDLSMDLTIPAGARTLSFTINSLFADSNSSASPPPDAFGVALLNRSTLVSLVPVVPATTDSFYIRDVVQGVTQGEAASGVTVSPTATSLPLTITLGIQGLDGRNARLLFRLLAGDDLSTSTVTISAVQLAGVSTGPVNTVPEPSSLFLGLSPLVLLVAHGWRRRDVRPGGR